MKRRLSYVEDSVPCVHPDCVFAFKHSNVPLPSAVAKCKQRFCIKASPYICVCACVLLYVCSICACYVPHISTRIKSNENRKLMLKINKVRLCFVRKLPKAAWTLQTINLQLSVLHKNMNRKKQCLRTYNCCLSQCLALSAHRSLLWKVQVMCLFLSRA
jgi:hypothetical protein